MSDSVSPTTTRSLSDDTDGLPTRVERQVVETSGQVTIGELAEKVTDTESVGPDHSSAEVHEALYDHVLADLESEGKLEFDADTGMVRPTRPRDDPVGGRSRLGFGRFTGVTTLILPLLMVGVAALATGWNPLPMVGAGASGLALLLVGGHLAS